MKKDVAEVEQSLVSKKRKVIIVSATLIFLVAVALFLYFKPTDTFAGQAYKVQTKFAPNTATPNEIYFENIRGFAHPTVPAFDGNSEKPEYVDIPVKFRVDLANNPDDLNDDYQYITTLQFCFQFDTTKFEAQSFSLHGGSQGQVKFSDWSLDYPGGLGASVVLNTPDGDSPCNNGDNPGTYTNMIDLISGTGGEALVSGDFVLGTLKLKVKSGADLSGNPGEDKYDKVWVATKGVVGTNLANANQPDTNLKQSFTEIAIVPKCYDPEVVSMPDGDGDGFPDPKFSTVDGTRKMEEFEAFNPAKDYRACPTFDPVTNTIGHDCDDGNPQKFPGNPEQCNGVDNDCSGVADNLDLGAAGTQKGVCVGQQVCLASWGVNGIQNGWSVGTGGSGALTDQQKVDIKAAYPGAFNFIFGQQTLVTFEKYEPGDELSCDCLDNDCDGSIDEGLVDCNCQGGGPAGPAILADVPGNVFMDYVDITPGAALQDPQDLTDLDPMLTAYYVAKKDDPCGGVGQAPCHGTPGNADTWWCKAGNYWQAAGGTLGVFSEDANFVTHAVGTWSKLEVNVLIIGENLVTC